MKTLDEEVSAIGRKSMPYSRILDVASYRKQVVG